MSAVQWASRKSCCTLCGKNIASIRYDIGICAGCDETVRQRTEIRFWEAIKDRLPPPSSRDDVLTGRACGEGIRRADVSWVGSDRVVFLEIDEYSHSNRPISCELKKLGETKWGLAKDLQCRFTVFVRVNPDAQPGSDVSFETRCDDAVETVLRWIDGDLTGLDALKPHVEYLHYGNSGFKHVEAAREEPKIVVWDRVIDV